MVVNRFSQLCVVHPLRDGMIPPAPRSNAFLEPHVGPPIRGLLDFETIQSIATIVTCQVLQELRQRFVRPEMFMELFRCPAPEVFQSVAAILLPGDEPTKSASAPRSSELASLSF